MIHFLESGNPAPLGAHWDGHGINFALFSANGEKVELCLFEADGRKEICRLPLPARSGDVWHGYLPNALPGLLYGYRVYGPYRPEGGHRFNGHKLLIDPYARSVSGGVQWNAANFAHQFAGSHGERSFDTRDNAQSMPKSVVVAPRGTLSHKRPETPWARTILYELHVKGMTFKHPDVPAVHRGTLAGLTAPAVIAHLRALGITAVELMPVFAFADETHLSAQGLSNYWGYNPYSFFALDPRYLSADDDFTVLIERYHDAGLEVILDVVFNHTAEGDALGPTLSLRGIDNAIYYWLDPADPATYVNHSGCGNTLNVLHPQVQRLILDSLGTWAAFGVDGFRFDLAPILGHTAEGFSPDSPLLRAIAADPVLSKLKMIAEPWDLSGHYLGRYPSAWGQWNDRYRDTVRRFWRGDAGQLPDLATRLAGSSDLLGRPSASINYVASHDGRPLNDIVTYAHRHNESNGEDNRDGNANEIAWNCGVEGPTTDETICLLRERQKRNLVATLILSHGVPMMLSGDELGHSQFGNNNAYCQDNDVSWLDWSRLREDGRFLDFVRRILALRASTHAFARDLFFTGDALQGEAKDLAWLRPDGREMTTEDWREPNQQCLGCLLSDHGHSLLIALNASREIVPFVLPPDRLWRIVLDTWSDAPGDVASGAHDLPPQSMCVFRDAAL